MRKYFYLALVCLTSVSLFTACNGGNGNNPKDPQDGSLEGVWITNPDQFKDYTPNDSINDCYQWDVWCDGTTIGREYMWTTEAAIIWMIQQTMAAEIKVFGEYHKKYMYTKVEEPTEAACTSRQWEGAECWIETITYKNANGDLVSEQEYCWLPEQNMKERHDYYMEKLESIGVFNHTYERANINDKDACLDMNPSDTTIVTPPDPEEKDYTKYDSINHKCWKVTVSYMGVSQTEYIWSTERNLVETLDQQPLEYTYEEADAADEDSCKALDNDDPQTGEGSCWEVTMSFMGQGTTVYVWMTESALVAYKEGLEAQGMTVTYKAATADDEDACENLNN